MERTYLEANDVSRELDLSASTVRDLANRGALPVAARTARGGRLFSPSAIAEFKLRREAARRARMQPSGDEAA